MSRLSFEFKRLRSQKSSSSDAELTRLRAGRLRQSSRGFNRITPTRTQQVRLHKPCNELFSSSSSTSGGRRSFARLLLWYGAIGGLRSVLEVKSSGELRYVSFDLIGFVWGVECGRELLANMVGSLRWLL